LEEQADQPQVTINIVAVVVITIQDSTSSRFLPGSSYSCCIRNLHVGKAERKGVIAIEGKEDNCS
jgi:hypothetical protein